jgi:hypothetical protein
MGKEESHWLYRVVSHVGSQQNMGQKSVMDPSCQHNFCGHQQPQGHNKQESTTFILPYGSNKQHCMDKDESLALWCHVGSMKLVDANKLINSFSVVF